MAVHPRNDSGSYKAQATLIVSADLPAVKSKRHRTRSVRTSTTINTPWSPRIVRESRLDSEIIEKKKPLLSPQKKYSPPARSSISAQLKTKASHPGKGKKPRIVRVAAQRGLLLRKKPWGEVLESLPFGEEVELLDDQEDWAKVRSDLNTGFVYRKYVTQRTLGKHKKQLSPEFERVEISGVRTISQNTKDPFDPSGSRGKFPSGYCGPASLQMVLDYFGVQKSRDYLVLTDVGGGKIYRVGRGSAYAPMVTMSRHLGFSATEIIWAKRIEKIHDRLTEGRPQIVSLRGPLKFKSGGRNRTTNGHIVVVTGINWKGDVIIHDPAGAGMRTVMTEADFLKAWRGFMVDVKSNELKSKGHPDTA